MSDLKISISAEADCDSIFVFETTGSYQECCNTTGFGDPNLRVEDITSSKIIIKGDTMPEPITIDVTGILPSDCNHGVEILPSEIGLEKIESGVYQIELIHTYETSDGEVEYFSTKNYCLFYECLRCCIEGGLAAVNLSNIDSKESIRAYRIKRLFDTMLWAAEMGRHKDASKIAEYLRHQCDCCL